MVATATQQVIKPDDYASSGAIPPRPRSVNTATSSSRVHQVWELTSEAFESERSEPVINVIVPSVTGAQVPKTEIAGSFTTGIWLARTAEPRDQSSLKELPRPKRIVVTFEPHFRKSTIGNLQSAVSRFRQSLGEADAAACKAALKLVLAQTYKQSVLSPDTRNLASAISLLEMFLRPHWSQISAPKLDAINEKLKWLAAQEEITSRVLERLYRELVAVIGSRILIQSAVRDDDEEEENNQIEP